MTPLEELDQRILSIPGATGFVSRFDADDFVNAGHYLFLEKLWDSDRIVAFLTQVWTKTLAEKAKGTSADTTPRNST